MSSESQGIGPLEAAIAELEAKRDELQKLIDGLKAQLGSGGSSGTSAPLNRGAKVEGPGEFLGMTIADAAVKLLGFRKKALSNPEIANAIMAGGVVLSSSDPVNTVGSVLNRRATQVQDIVRVGKTWGLAEWYPNAGRFNRRRGRESDPSTSEPE